MKTMNFKVLVGVSMIACANMAFAGFPSLGGVLGGGDSGSGVSASQIVKKYTDGSKNVISSDAKMLDAVGLKTEGAKAALQAKNLTEGATKDSLEEVTKTQTESSKALEDKLKDKNLKMDAASKKLFSDGVKDLGRGVIQYVGLGKDASGFKPAMSLDESNKSALYAVKSLPDSIKTLASTLKLAIEFSKANDIPVPKEANDATSML